jgi:hypothetical protein
LSRDFAKTLLPAIRDLNNVLLFGVKGEKGASKVHLLYRYVNENKGWQSTTLEKVRTEIEAFYDIEEAKEKLRNREIILCGVRLLRLYNGIL